MGEPSRISKKSKAKLRKTQQLTLPLMLLLRTLRNLESMLFSDNEGDNSDGFKVLNGTWVCVGGPDQERIFKSGVWTKTLLQ